MVFKNFADGNILTAGSLNHSLNTHLQFVGGRFGTVTQKTGSFDDNTSILDVYVSSGNVAPAQCFFIASNWSFRNTADATTNSIPKVSIGASGTSPTLTDIGSMNLICAAANERDGGVMFALGSTTVDDASVPALIRFRTSNQNDAQDELELRDYAVFAVISGAGLS